MAKPQQPELHRSSKGATDPASAKARAKSETANPSATAPGTRNGGGGPIPEDNLPGHHPEHEQDKPERPPRAKPRPPKIARSSKAHEIEAAINEPAESEVRVGELTFRVLTAGPDDGELVILLHGWPQTADMWRPQLRAIAGAGRGFRAVAPDQRGYSPGARPTETSAYALDNLTADVLGLADELGAKRFHLVGHDWGGVVAWALAAQHPDQVSSLTVFSTPHPKAYLEAIPRSLQGLRSLYIGLFALRGIPELLFGAGHQAGLRWMLRSGLPKDVADTYAERMAEPGAFTAALNWYRALRPSAATGAGDVTVPTLYVWSTGDPALGPTAARLTARHVSGDYRFEVLEGVNHWIPESRPDVTTRLILEQLTAREPATA